MAAGRNRNLAFLAGTRLLEGSAPSNKEARMVIHTRERGFGRRSTSKWLAASLLVGLLGWGGMGCGGRPGDFDESASELGVTRTYFIAADEVEWDYAPLGFNNITGEPFDDAANVFVQNGPDRIGSKYVKALYR